MEENKEKKPKILVTSIPCWNNVSGSDTLSSLLEGYGSEYVANIYFKNGTPTSPVCSRYFCISEGAVIKSIFKRHTETGKEQKAVSADTSYKASVTEQNEIKRYSFWIKHRNWIFLFAREIAWWLGKWKSKVLEEFVDDFQPDVIFFPIESYLYFNRVNEWLIKKTKCSAIGFLWDDNFTYNPNKYSVGFLINRFIMRRNVRRLGAKCSCIFAISPKMKVECDAFLNINSVLLTKGVVVDESVQEYHQFSYPYHIVYTGKLILGRDQTLIRLVNAIKQENKKFSKFILDIYSTTNLGKDILSKLDVPGSSVFHGSVPQNEVKKIQKKADILLVAEALEGKWKYASRLSFSTKITDYMGCRRCMLVVAPTDIATTEYLKQHNAALIASNKQEMQEVLKKIHEVPTILNDYAERAYSLSKKNHNIETNRKKLFEEIKRAAMPTLRQ